jgi:hypothetical protein
MSQKTNPVSLRLQNSNKHFQSCWYSDIFYDQVLGDEIKLGTYIESVLYQAGRSKTLPSVSSQYRRYFTFLFLLDTRGERHKREYSLKLSREPIQHVLSPRLKFLPNKNKPRMCALDDLLFNQVQDKLCRKSLPQDMIYNCVIEDGTKAKANKKYRSHNTRQEYVYNYAIKGSSLEPLPFSGIASARSSNGQSPYAYNSIINPELKVRFTSSNGPTGFYKKKVKGFYRFSMTELALARGMCYKQEAPIKALALALFLKQGLDASQAHLFGTLSKIQNTLKAKAGKGSTKNMFELSENLFRRLIIDRCSQSTQNRLSYSFATRLKKQVTSAKMHSISTEKPFKDAVTFTPITQMKKTSLKKSTTRLTKRQWYRHTELFINLHSDTFGFHTLYPVRAISPLQSAGFLIESVAYLLQRKSSFRQIKDDIFRELGQSQLIKGMRLSCSGRLGGRSKKAQKAKTQSAQWGETSLTVFSSRLAFASKGVSTAYGKVGVKIWLCYKS